VIATEGGEWEVSVGGAAGAHVRKTDVLCRVQTKEEALRVIGRFLIYYRDNAKWLERTYDFVPRLGIEQVRDIIVNDSARHRRSARCEVEKTIAAYVDPWLERDNPAFAGQFDETSACRCRCCRRTPPQGWGWSTRPIRTPALAGGVRQRRLPMTATVTRVSLCTLDDIALASGARLK